MSPLEPAEVSRGLMARARGVIPGGVNSPVRAYRAVGGVPRFIREGQGAHVVDADGRRYIDLVMSYGPLLFGHAAPEVVAAVAEAARRGLAFGAPTEGEVELAEEIREAMPGLERVRLVTSGTEAVMTAVRLARAHTGRTGILKFAGGYHGHADALLTASGSGTLTLGLPGSAGVPPEVTRQTVTVPYGQLAAAETAAAQLPGGLAAIVVERVAANMGVLAPPEGFLEGLRRLADRHQAVLIFDEVITGFRVARGGAQALYGVRPDLTCLGKVIGGGLPLAAFGGKAAIMDRLAPEGDVYQAGTLAGNPVAVAAGLAMLRKIRRENPYPQLDAAGRAVADGLSAAAAQAGVPVQVHQVGSLVSVRIGAPEVPPWEPVPPVERQGFAAFFHAMREEGVLLPPSPREALFLSTAHDPLVQASIAEAAARAWPRVAQGAEAGTSA